MTHRFAFLSLVVMAVAGRVAFAADYALLVAVKNYGKRSGLNSLKYTENDIEDLAKLLIESGYRKENVSVLTQTRGLTEPALFPTHANLMREMDLLLDGLSADDSLLVAFAGHGVKFKDGKTSYFCPVDTELSGRKNLVSYQVLYERLQKCRAQRKLLLSDACRNDPLAAGSRSAPSLTKPQPQPPTGSTIALFACKEGQEAKEDDELKHGVFFHYVLEALRGAADKQKDGATGNGNKTVELTELAAFTEKRVRDHVRGKWRIRQEPDLQLNSSSVQQLLRYPVLKLSQVPLVITNSIGMKLRLIKAGSFQMGATKTAAQLATLFDTKAEYFDDELPRHGVTISQDFRLGVTEVTQSQWQSVMNTQPWSGKSFVKEGADYPAMYVSWDDAVEFCRKLSVKEGVTYRLPTEAEWEYACRAGSTTMFGFGDSLGSLKDYAWFDGNAYDLDEKFAHRVGQKRPNAWGLYDMHGNVWEWCSDWYGADYYRSSPVTDPGGPSSGSYRVSRGGSWILSARYCRSADRRRNSPGIRDYGLGFRVLRSSIK